MSTVHAILLGLVEGVTEFLPISSTAHLVLTARVLEVPESAFLGSFIIAIQLGAIAAVVCIYWRTILFDFETGKRVLAAFIPTAIVGYVLYGFIKGVLFESLDVIAWALLVGGIVLIVFERFKAPAPPQIAGGISLATLPYHHAILVGCAQSLAVIPGVSRAGATILGGLALGIERRDIVTFSFLLAIPTMLAATGYDLLKTGATFAAADWKMLAIGFIVSFIAAYASVRWLLKYIQTHTFTAFGWYRVVLGIFILGAIAFV